MQALRRQFPTSEGYSEMFKTKFKFTNQPPSERKIEIKFARGHSDEWMLALESMDKVSVTSQYKYPLQIATFLLWKSC